MKLIILDFSKAKNKEDALAVFQNAFEFTIVPKNLDSLDDMLASLDTESRVYIQAKAKVKVSHINLENNRFLSQSLKVSIMRIFKDTVL